MTLVFIRRTGLAGKRIGGAKYDGMIWIREVEPMAAKWGDLEKAVSDNSLSIALFSLFLVCVAAQAVSGWFAYSGALAAVHFPQIGFFRYLGTGNFLDGILSNWQAAVLQLAVLIIFSSVLRQKGAAHSRKTKPKRRRTLKWNLQSRETMLKWLYANSLSLAFIGMFVVTFGLHMLFGNWNYNEQQALMRLPPVSLGDYALSSSFWFTVLQCWEAEFGAIGVYIVLSIFLRQDNSPESKRVEASDEQTGETNE